MLNAWIPEKIGVWERKITLEESKLGRLVLVGRRSTSCNEAQIPLQCEQSCVQLATRNFTCLLQVHSLLAAQLYQAMYIYIYLYLYLNIYIYLYLYIYISLLYNPRLFSNLRSSPLFGPLRDHLHRSVASWRRPTPPASWRRDEISVRCCFGTGKDLLSSGILCIYTVYVIYEVYTCVYEKPTAWLKMETNAGTLAEWTWPNWT